MRIPNTNGFAIWLTGLSSSGKTTIAMALEKKLVEKNYFVNVIDGDVLRDGLNKNLGFSIEDRNENIRRSAEVAKLFVQSGFICICSFISPTHTIRAMAKEIIGAERFVEVFVNAPLAVCEQRDVKGLYKKARAGELKEFTGIDSPYEIPQQPDIMIETSTHGLDEEIESIVNELMVLKKI
ncbi:MAG: adenylyl-sulfate kinase [Bacteroidota bacterium]